MRKISKDSFDEQLVTAAKAGDKIAYGRLVKLHQSSLRGFLRKLTKQDFALADDLAQDAFMQGYRQIESFKQQSSFRTWISSIAYNRFLQYLRKNKRRKELIDSTVNIEEPLNNSSQDIQIDVERALNHLRLEERTAILLNHSQGMSHKEIAIIMHMPLGTVKSHITRGRETLKSLLSNHKPKGLV